MESSVSTRLSRQKTLAEGFALNVELKYLFNSSVVDANIPTKLFEVTTNLSIFWLLFGAGC